MGADRRESTAEKRRRRGRRATHPSAAYLFFALFFADFFAVFFAVFLADFFFIAAMWIRHPRGAARSRVPSRYGLRSRIRLPNRICEPVGPANFARRARLQQIGRAHG